MDTNRYKVSMGSGEGPDIKYIMQDPDFQNVVNNIGRKMGDASLMLHSWWNYLKKR